MISLVVVHEKKNHPSVNFKVTDQIPKVKSTKNLGECPAQIFGRSNFWELRYTGISRLSV